MNDFILAWRLNLCLCAQAFAPPTKKESAAKVQQMKQKATVEPDTNEEERQAEKAAKQLVRENAEKEGVEAPIDTSAQLHV